MGAKESPDIRALFLDKKHDGLLQKKFWPTKTRYAFSRNACSRGFRITSWGTWCGPLWDRNPSREPQLGTPALIHRTLVETPKENDDDWSTTRIDVIVTAHRTPPPPRGGGDDFQKLLSVQQSNPPFDVERSAGGKNENDFPLMMSFKGL